MRLYPYRVAASSCGALSVSLSTFQFNSVPGSYSIVYNNIDFNPNTYDRYYPYIYIEPLFINESYFYNLYLYTFENNTYVIAYSAQTINDGEFPLNGWVSLNSLFNPPPTFTITRTVPPVSSVFSTPDFSYSSNRGYITEKDCFLTVVNNDTTINMYTSSINIPNVRTLRISDTPKVDLSYFTLLSNVFIGGIYGYQTTSLNLKRNKNLKTIEINNILEPAISNNLKGNNLDRVYIGSYITNIPLMDSVDTFVGIISANDRGAFLIDNSSIKNTIELNFTGQSRTAVISGCAFRQLIAYWYGDSSSPMQHINISNNNNLGIVYTSFNLLTGATITNCPKLSGIQLSYSSQLSALTLPNKVTVLFIGPATPNVIDSLYSAFDNNSTDYKSLRRSNDKRLAYNTYSGDIYYSIRTTASDSNFCSLLRKDYDLPLSDYNSGYFSPVKPTGYIPCTDHCNNLIITSPISARNGAPQILNYGIYDFFTVRHKELSGVYTKVGDIHNDRDVWKNSNNYYILYNNLAASWTVVGPLSTSSTIWLSATENKSYFGDPPAMGWFGRSYTTGGFQGGSNRNPATFGTVFGQSTTVTSTKNLLFSSFNTGEDFSGQGYLGQGNLRYQGNPNNGVNNEFFLKDCRFLDRMVLGNFSNPLAGGKGYLISPIHFVYNFHFPPGWTNFTHPNNSTIRLYNSTGGFVNRVAISGRPVNNDLCVGILDTAVPSPFTSVYLASSYYAGNVTTLNELSSFVVGPLQSGRFGCMPFVVYNNETQWGNPGLGIPMYGSFSALYPWGNYDKIYTINKALLIAESIAGADSGAAAWVLSGNNPILIGLTQFVLGGPTAYGATVIDNLTQNMNTLSQTYSKPFYKPTLAIFDT